MRAHIYIYTVHWQTSILISWRGEVGSGHSCCPCSGEFLWVLCPARLAMGGQPCMCTHVCAQGKVCSASLSDLGTGNRSSLVSAGLGEEPSPAPKATGPLANKGPPADGGPLLPAHLRKGVSPCHRSSGVFHAVSFCSSTKPRWDSLDFLTALSPACSYYHQRRSCPLLTLLPHQHEASLCPEAPLSRMLLNHGCQIPASAQGGDGPPPQSFDDLPTLPS